MNGNGLSHVGRATSTPLNLRRLEVLSTYKIFYLQKNILISDPPGGGEGGVSYDNI